MDSTVFTTTRRAFLGGAGGGAFGAWACASAQVVPGAGMRGLIPAADVMLAPGFVHLQTSTVGAMPRPVFEATVRAALALETDPIRGSYGPGRERLNLVRASLARLVGARMDDIVLTTGTTSGMNMIAQGLDLGAGDRVLTTQQQHHGGRLCWDWFATHRGVAVDTVPVEPDEDDADALVDRIARAITPATRVLSVSHILYSTGLRMPVERLCRLARERGLLAVIDGAQAVGAMPVDVAAIGCHAYAGSGHKWLLGPKGTGFLYLSPEVADRVRPMALQSGRRANEDSAGLGNIAGMHGLGAAIDYLLGVGLDRIERRNLELRDRLAEALRPIDGIAVAGPTRPALKSALLAFRLPAGADPAPIRLALAERHNVFVRVVDEDGFKGLRASPHVYNDAADLKALVAALRTELPRA